jgi:short-chain 2-methylacyl-CoA dehydrogenase
MLARVAHRGLSACSSFRRFFGSIPPAAPGPATLLTEEESAIRDSVRKFAEADIAPLAANMDRNSELDEGILRSMFRQGLMGMEIPLEFGGSGLGLAATCVAVEALAETDPAVAVVCDIQNTLINNAIIQYGTEDQKKRFLPRLAEDLLGSFCLSEAGSGSDAFAMKSTAKRKEGSDGSWILEGTKLWVSNAREAGLFIVFANANREAGYKGITAFLVDRDVAEARLVVGKKEDKLGIRASSTCEVQLDGVEVGVQDVLGGVGTGYKIAIGVLNEGRVGIGAQMVGLAQGAMRAALSHCYTRRQFGRPVGEFQGMGFQFAAAATDLAASRALVYDAARLRDAGCSFTREAAFAKLHASEMAGRVTSQCMDWAGGVGYTRDLPLEKFYRDAKIGTIYEGTSNMQLATIAKFLEKEYSVKPAV